MVLIRVENHGELREETKNLAGAVVRRVSTSREAETEAEVRAGAPCGTGLVDPRLSAYGGPPEDPLDAGARRKIAFALGGVVFVVLVGFGVWFLGRPGRLLAEEEALVAQLARDGLSVEYDALHPTPTGTNGAPALREVLNELDTMAAEAQWSYSDASQRWLDPTGWEALYAHDEQLRTEIESRAAPFAALTDLEARVDRALAADVVVFEVDWELGYEAQTPHLMQLKVLLEVLRYRALLALDAGDPTAVWPQALRMLRVIRCVPSDMLISHLVRGATIELWLEGLRTFVEFAPPPSREQREQLQALLAELDDRTRYTDAMRGELFVMRTSLPDNAGEMAHFLESNQGTPLGEVGLHWLMPERLRLVQTMAQVIRASTLPAEEVPAALGAIEAQVEAERTYIPLTDLLLPALVRSYSAELKARARLRAASVLLDLAAAGPPLPEQLSKPPADPFAAGETLRWRRDDARHGVVWSVGPDNENDDAQRPDPTAGDRDDWDDVYLDVTLPAK